MSDFVQLIFSLSIIIAAAKAGGFVSVKLRQPAVLGELLVGLLLGPTVLDILHWGCFTCIDLHSQITNLAEMGVIVLMLLAGLELQLPDLLRTGKLAAFAGTLGVVVPVALGWGTSLLFGFSQIEGVFIGLTLAATSVSISAQTLMELGVLHSKVGLSMLGAAVFDDILVILLLSLFFALAGGSGAETAGLTDILLIGGRIVLFLAVGSVIGIWVLPRFADWVADRPISQGLVALTVVVAFIYAFAAEWMGGVASITGAFMAGLFLGRTPYREHIERAISVLAYSFFVPIFFVDIGLGVNLLDLPLSALVFTLVISVVAIISKILGSGLGARLGGMNNSDALKLGVGMVSRGEVGLIVVAVGVARGVVGNDIFSAVVAMVIVATLFAPPALRWLFRDEVARKNAQADRSEHAATTAGSA